ncbi:MAG: hypothetical protein IPF73_06970 [Betaproteobacteria bacterium]|nr:hypothetical protein [Betaproteobacteria bacterium]
MIAEALTVLPLTVLPYSCTLPPRMPPPPRIVGRQYLVFDVVSQARPVTVLPEIELA